MIYPDTMKDEYDAFVTGMVTEYNKHWDKNGDSWKIMKPSALYDLMVDSHVSFKDMTSNPNHLFDIANYAMFLWYNIQKEKSDNAMNSIQCPECGEWIKKDEFDLHLMKTRPDIMIEQIRNMKERLSYMGERLNQVEKDRDTFIKDLEDMANQRDAYKDAIDSIPEGLDISLKHIILTLENKVKKE